MTKYFVTYDLERTNPEPYSTMLDEAEKRGWSRWIWGPKNQKWLRLPNTTLVGDFPNSEAANKALKDSVAATAKAIGRSVDLEKYLLGTYGSEIYDSDVKVEPKK